MCRYRKKHVRRLEEKHRVENQLPPARCPPTGPGRQDSREGSRPLPRRMSPAAAPAAEFPPRPPLPPLLLLTLATADEGLPSAPPPPPVSPAAPKSGLKSLVPPQRLGYPGLDGVIDES
ncbi:unnamed protein product, partial [Sphacelaria rigidula]